jgi:hypothetical protein
MLSPSREQAHAEFRLSLYAGRSRGYEHSVHYQAPLRPDFVTTLLN